MCVLNMHTTGREVILKDGNTIKQEQYKNREVQEHFGIWGSVKTRKKSRLIISQILIQFFLFERRKLDFRWLTQEIDSAIDRLGTGL